MAENEIFDGLNLPYSLESEQAVLGSVLLDPSVLSTVQIHLKPEHFYLPQHRAIFTAMITIDTSGIPIDPLVVLENLKRDGVYDDAGGKNYLFQLSQIVPSTANVETYAKIVKEKFYVRSLINASREIIDAASNEDEKADVLLDAAEQKIYDIRQGSSSDAPSKIGDIIVNEVYDRLQKLSTPELREQFKGISTGFGDLDEVLTGLHKSDLVLIGARPAMGKTSFALNLATNVALNAKRKVLFFSLEMSKEQLAQRVLSTQARVSSKKMRTGELTPDEWTRLSMATDILSRCELYFDDTSTITVPEMKAKIRKTKGIDCVFIDYLGLIHSARRTENRVQEVSEITRSLKLMAKDLKIPIVVCSQLNRGPEGRGKAHKPQLSELRESGSIEQDADIVMLLYRKEYYDDNEEEASPDEPKANEVEVIVAKNRHGETRDVKLAWNGEFTVFTSIERIRNDM